MCLSLCLSRALSVCLSPPSLPLVPPLVSLAFAYEKQEDRDRGRGGEAGAEGCEVQEGRAQGQVGRGSERER